MKRRATETVELPAQLLTIAMNGANEAVLNEMCNKHALRKIVQRTRAEKSNKPGNPEDLEVLQFVLSSNIRIPCYLSSM